MTTYKHQYIIPQTSVEHYERPSLYAPEISEVPFSHTSASSFNKQTVEADFSMTDVTSHFDAYDGVSCEIKF